MNWLVGVRQFTIYGEKPWHMVGQHPWVRVPHSPILWLPTQSAIYGYRTYGDMKCGGFNKLVGVDSECDSWVLETIHGVASGSATIIWSKRLSHRDCPSATVRLRVAPQDALSAKFTFVWFSQRLYWSLSERSGVSADPFFGRRATAWMRLCCLYGVSIVLVKDYAWPLQVKCKS